MSVATCPPSSELERLFLGGLSDAEADALEQHVLGCAACRQTLEQLLGAKDSLAAALVATGASQTSVSASPAVRDLVKKLKSLQPRSVRPTPRGNGMVTISCASCQKKLSVKEALVGKKIKCPGCGQLTAVLAPVPAAVDEMRTVAPAAPLDGPTMPPSVPNAGDGPTDPPSALPDATMGVTPTGHDASLTDFLSPSQAADELGRLGQYRILKILGHGGMGVVYQGEDLKLKRSVAVKAMLPTLAASASCAQRFMREAEAMAAVEHDHIVRIYQVDDERGIPFMAMEFLKGEPLDARLNRDEPLTVQEILRIGREIATGLNAAHAKGLIHRDIKPGNVWLEAPRGRVKILDFGLARASSQEAGLTQQGAIIGTPAYMAPEQARGSQVDARCDLFSLGVILYRMSTGIRPFVGTDTVSTLMEVAMTEPKPPIEVKPELPRELSDLVMKLLEKDPRKRPKSAAEVVRTIQEIMKKVAQKKKTPEKTELVPVQPPKPSELGPAKTPTKKSKKPARARGPIRPWMAVAAAAFAFLGLFGAGGVYYIVTDKGTVEITTDDEDVQVVILKNGKEVEIVNPKTKKTWRLNTGAYTLKLKDDPDGFEIALPADQKFDLIRGGTVAVSIRRKAAGAVAKAEPGSVPPLKGKELPGWGVVVDPDGDCTFDNKKDSLVIGVPGGQHNLNPLPKINNFSAPRVVQQVTGDFEVQVKVPPFPRPLARVSVEPGKPSYVGAGLLVWADNKNFIRFLRADSGEGPNRFAGLEAYHDGELALFENAAWPGTGGYLRLERRQGKFSWAASADGVTWQPQKKPLSLDFPPKVSVGVLAVNSTTGRFAPEFSEFKLTPGSSDSVPLFNGVVSIVQKFLGHVGPVTSVALRGDGKLAFTGSRDTTAIRWDTATGKKTHTYLGHPLPILAIALSADGKRLLTGSDDRTAILHDADTGKKIQTFKGHADVISCVAISRDGEFVLTGSGDRAAILWQASSAKKIQTFRHPNVLRGVALSADAKFALTGSQDKTAVLWEAASGKKIQTLRGHDGWVNCVALSSDGTLALTGSQDKTAILWDAASGKKLRAFVGHTGAIHGVALSADGKYVATASADKTAIVWEAATGKKLHTLQGHTDALNSVAFNADSQHVLTGSDDGTAILWAANAAAARRAAPMANPSAAAAATIR